MKRAALFRGNLRAVGCHERMHSVPVWSILTRRRAATHSTTPEGSYNNTSKFTFDRKSFGITAAAGRGGVRRIACVQEGPALVQRLLCNYLDHFGV